VSKSKRAKYRHREDCAIEVWIALESVQDGGLSLVELTKTTGLTQNQVKAGLREINHVKQLANEQPIMVNPDGWRYVLPEYYPDLLPWTINRIRDLLTRLQAERVRIMAAKAKWPAEVGRDIPKLVDRLTEDMTDALALVESGE
jgi:hypothetical protein